jgi:ferrous iron transport protein A
MGLLPGESIEMIGSAPMGDPTEYMVFNYRLSLRKPEAKRVLIERT